MLRHRLRRRLDHWEEGGASPQVLSWIREGVRCPWLRGGPPPPFHHGESLLDATRAQREWLHAETERCLASGAWEPATARSHVSRAFLVPKPSPPGAPPKWRLVVDLRELNRYCRGVGCEYETLRRLQRLARRGDWMISFDLQDGYHAIGIHPDHRRYFTFSLPGLDGVPRYYQCAALPFGWNLSPYVFTKTMRVMVRRLRAPLAPARLPTWRGARGAAARALRLRVGSSHPSSVGMRVLPYVDDFLVLARTRAECFECRRCVERLLARLGLARHPDKGFWEPTQALVHLGLGVDTARGLFVVPPHKQAQISEQATRLLHTAARRRRLVSALQLASLAGRAQAVHLACPSARFYLREIHTVIASRSSWGALVRLSRQALRDLRWWAALPSAGVTRAIWRSPVACVLHSDASRRGWGAMLNSAVPAHGFWTPRERGHHITYLELMAVHRALLVFLEQVRGRSVLLWEDNQAVRHILTAGCSRSPEIMRLLRRVWWLLDSEGIDLRVEYIRSEDNVGADALSRIRPEDETALRRPAFLELERRWGPHTVDRFAAPGNSLLPRFNSLIPARGVEAVNALAQRWDGENNYAFPPRHLLDPLAQFLLERTVDATVVAPYWPAQAWFQQLFSAASDLVVLPARGALSLHPHAHPLSARSAFMAPLVAFRLLGRSAPARLR